MVCVRPEKAFDSILNQLRECRVAERRLVIFGVLIRCRAKLRFVWSGIGGFLWIKSEMMLCVSPNCVVRSSLEEMLEALQRRDEREMLRDVPPALPRRAVARSRPPSAKRRLPVAVSSGCVVKGEMRGQNEVSILAETADTLFEFCCRIGRIVINFVRIIELCEVQKSCANFF